MVKELVGWFGQTFSKTIVVGAVAPKKVGDANGDGNIDVVDFGIWKKGYLK